MGSVWSRKGLRTAPVICWRSVWRWGPAGQRRFSDRLVSHCLGLVSSLSCSSWRPGAHLFTDLKYRSGERGVAGGCNGYVENGQDGVGGFKSTIKLIQVFSKLLIHLSAGGWCPVLGDGFQAFPHWSGVIGSELIFQLFSVGPFSHSNFLIQCVPAWLYKTLFPFL